MSNFVSKLPPEQQAIRDKCFHPSGTFVEFPKEDVESSIPARFEKVVKRYPDQLAIRSELCRWSYQELGEVAKRIARAVHAKSLDEAVAVGLVCDNDASLVAAMIGILKVGKAVLLLDPSLPVDRITHMLEEAQAELVVCDSKNLNLAQEVTSRRYDLINCDSLGYDPTDAVSYPAVRPDDVAFIFYTSGSTGTPKGVMHHHRTMLHNVMLRTNSGHVCKHDRMALPRSGTSAAIANLLVAILNGATLYPFNFRKEGAARLADWFEQEGISVCTLSVPLFRSLTDVVQQPSFPQLRLLWVNSQAVHDSDFEQYKRCFSTNCFLVNRLSSSETGPLTEYWMSYETRIDGDAIPVGYALEDKELLLLDGQGKQVKFNQIGEIVVRSAYLSPGYWRRPELTESKFKTDPSDPSKRLYHTGDLAHMLPDGCLVHEGRQDFRIKIRGYGVDSLEIENAVRGHPKVRAAVVVVCRNKGGDEFLAAYFVPEENCLVSAGVLRAFLEDRFPDYMIPSRFAALTQLPLTPSGKIDRQALPDLGNARPDLPTSYVAPHTALSRELTQIWADVLLLDRVGIRDSFFALGGDSLTASKVIARVIKTFKLDLPLKALFDAPTVAEMAAIIEQHQSQQPHEETLNRMLGEIEAMTEEEARKELAGESTRSSSERRHD